ncbi:gluconokinase [Acetobacter sacchari]|nr:gluconokinase [Acetobacter sacchari]
MTAASMKAGSFPFAEGLAPRIVVVMGVSGTGKSTVADGLHNLLGWPFQEGDALHPKSNVEKMAAGVPLTDEDRWPWLDTCRDWISERAKEGRGGVLTCSALKRIYRDRLRSSGVDITFLFLAIPEDVISARLQRREGHFMPASLLPSQFATLEEPDADEHVLVLPLTPTPAEQIADAVEALRQDQIVRSR